MKAVNSSTVPVPTYQTIQCHNPEDHISSLQYLQNHKFYQCVLWYVSTAQFRRMESYIYFPAREITCEMQCKDLTVEVCVRSSASGRPKMDT